MAWVTKDSVETYSAPEPPKEYTKKEKAANWWHYNGKLVAVAIVAVALIAVFVKDTVLQTRPDIKIGYVGTTELPQDTITALQDALTPLCSDLNGDGKVVVQISQYTVDFVGEESNADAYYQMAGVTQLSAEVSDGETFIYILQDPAGFEKNTGVLRYLDGTLPDDAEPLPNDAWQQMVYRWGDCPVLAGLELGQYDGYTLMDNLTGDNQDVLANLYIGARGVWDDKNADKFAAGEALWQQLTAGAAAE